MKNFFQNDPNSAAKSGRAKKLALLGIIILFVAVPFESFAGTSNSLMDISADGRLLACSNRDTGTVTIVDLRTHSKIGEYSVGEKPEGVSFLGATHKLAVAVYAEDKVVFIDADNGNNLGTVDVFDEPYGIVSNKTGDRLFVTLDYPGRVVEIDSNKKTITREFNAGKFVRGIALSGDEKRVFITEYYTTNVREIELTNGKVVDEWPGISTSNLARQVVLHPKRDKAYVAHIRSVVEAIRGDGSIFPYVSVVDTHRGTGKRRKKIPMDAFRGALVTANPWEVAISPKGDQLYVIFGGTNDLFVCNVIDDDYKEIEYRSYMSIGQNPRAVRVAPDGKHFYVYNALDFNIVAYDATSLRPVATINVCKNPLGDEVLLGKQLFYSALQPMVGRRWISCSSCHPDGEPDGRTWHNPEGLRNTQSLAGMAWTHPIHWSADRDEVQDFEHTIRGKLMQGRGLIRGQLNAELGSPNKGISRQLDALAAYSNSHKFSLSPYAKKGLTPEAKRGRDIFLSNETGCTKCHSGPTYSDSVPRTPQEIVRHNVGTGQSDPSEKMGPEYDTPTLLGVYRTAPYLHHGKAKSLEEVLTTYNPSDTHGKTSPLSQDQIKDLVEFIKSLPYEDVEHQAKSAGLKKVDR